MSHLAPDDWQFADALLAEHRDTRWAGFHVVELLERSTELLHTHLRDGSIHAAAVGIADDLGVGDSRFTESLLAPGQFTTEDLDRLLRDGQFRFGRETQLIELFDICGECDGFAAAAPLDAPWLEVNLLDFLEHAEKRPAVYTRNRDGLDRLAADIAAVMLHEVMHVEGYLHEHRAENWFEFDRSDAYYRTLPAVAQQAIYVVADEYFRGSGHTPSRDRNRPAGCAGVGCRPQTTPRRPAPGGAAVEVPSPPSIFGGRR